MLRLRALERLPLSTPFACAALLPRSLLKSGARHPHRLALHDVPLEAGPTEVARGSHRLTNHLNGPPGALSVDDHVRWVEKTFADDPSHTTDAQRCAQTGDTDPNSGTPIVHHGDNKRFHEDAPRIEPRDPR